MSPSMNLILAVWLLGLTTGVAPWTPQMVATFRAAAYDYQPSFPIDIYFRAYTRPMALAYLEGVVLDEFSEAIRQASSKGSAIIAFPEYGLIPGMDLSRVKIYNFTDKLYKLDEIPCTTEDVGFEVQSILSCLAKKYNIYIVVNMGIRQKCHTKSEECYYNTNLIFSNDGTLKRAYFKENLFLAETVTFDIPDYDQLPVYLDTHFGRIATFTCFDILFRKPAIQVLADHSVDHVIFLTAWVNVYPYFSAAHFHSSFATAHGVNFISSNLHVPGFGLSGSGVYEPGRLLAYRDDYNSGSALLISDLRIKPVRIPQDKEHRTAHAYSTATRALNSSQFTIFGDVYNIVPLLNHTDDISICQDQFCCNLRYSFLPGSSSDEKFYFGVLNTLHTLQGQYYIQICTLINCGEGGTASCDLSRWSVSSKPLKRFTRVQISGHFPQRNVQPQVYTGLYATHQTIDWDGETLRYGDLDRGVVLRSATLFSRVYSKDSGSLRLTYDLAVLIAVLMFSVFYN